MYMFQLHEGKAG